MKITTKAVEQFVGFILGSLATLAGVIVAFLLDKEASAVIIVGFFAFIVLFALVMCVWMFSDRPMVRPHTPSRKTQSTIPKYVSHSMKQHSRDVGLALCFVGFSILALAMYEMVVTALNYFLHVASNWDNGIRFVAAFIVAIFFVFLGRREMKAASREVQLQ
jgi:heme/copper-type cytochrome/quinol oxidase subunit 4